MSKQGKIIGGLEDPLLGKVEVWMDGCEKANSPWLATKGGFCYVLFPVQPVSVSCPAPVAMLHKQ